MNTELGSKTMAFITLTDNSNFVEQPAGSVAEVDVSFVVRHLSGGVQASNIKRVGQLIGWNETTLLNVLDIPVSTYHRKIKGKSKLPRDESERLYRVVEVYNAALKLFEGEKEQVNEWMNHEMTALGSETPREMLKSELGAREVLNLINTLEYGMYT